MLRILTEARFAKDDCTGEIYIIDSAGGAVKLTEASNACGLTAISITAASSGGLTPYMAEGVIDNEAKTITFTFSDSHATEPMPDLRLTWTISANATMYLDGVAQHSKPSAYADYSSKTMEVKVVAQDGVTNNTYTATIVPYEA